MLFKKPAFWAVLFSVLLTLASVLTLLDTFVFEHESSETVEDWGVAVGQTNSGFERDGSTSTAPADNTAETEDALTAIGDAPTSDTTETADEITVESETPAPGGTEDAASTPAAEPTASSAPETPTGTDTPGITAAPEPTATAAPAEKPTSAPTSVPTARPTAKPTAAPTSAPTARPTADPMPKATPTPAPTPAPTQTPTSGNPVITDTSYRDDNISITITEAVYKSSDGWKTTYYVADIQLSSPEFLKTALASGSSLTTNKTAKVASQAKSNNAILAINGDGCGQQRSKGYVIRNGVAYRQKAWTDRTKAEDLVIKSDGTFSIIDERTTSADDLKNLGGVLNVFSFGPALINNGSICVDTGEEITGSKTMNSNPRTAIGMVKPLHYIMMVADGRTSASKGLSLYEMATILQEWGCQVAYNLDGGGSSTMWFIGKKNENEKGNVINYPTTGGGYSERAVSDIVYIGY